ncbi:MAG: hypothetical protein EBY38_09585 [Flavobacteriaceae bacterium]|nr:hypothetical protein [Flavobacteriaceae bacterium]
MSRFSTTNTKGEKFVYGYDRPLQEYFLQKQEDFDFVELVGTLSSVRGTNGNLLEVAEQHGVIIPDDHRDKIVFDFPI